eukprot:SAG25_NODE_1376_length_3170_cov_1.458483_2_plen_185_part_00
MHAPCSAAALEFCMRIRAGCGQTAGSVDRGQDYLRLSMSVANPIAAAAAAKTPEGQFRAMDVNGDGFISMDEWMAEKKKAKVLFEGSSNCCGALRLPKARQIVTNYVDLANPHNLMPHLQKEETEELVKLVHQAFEVAQEACFYEFQPDVRTTHPLVHICLHRRAEARARAMLEHSSCLCRHMR